MVCAFAQTDVVSPERIAAREAYRGARFGMFVHWGVYSVLGDGEWVMQNKKIPIANYEKLPALFNPTEFNAAEWVGLAKAAGMKYLTIPGEDFQMFEKDLPGGRTAEFNKDSEIGDLPLETCETMNGSWGFNITDRRYKSTRDLIRYLARAAGSNANFLLNVGPMSNGHIQPEFVARLRDVGTWLTKNGEAIYGTRGGPIAPHVWGVTTRKGNRVYVHVLDVPDQALLLPPLGAKIRGARFLSTGRTAEFSEHEFGVVVKLPADAVDPFDTIVALDLDSKS